MLENKHLSKKNYFEKKFGKIKIGQQKFLVEKFY